MLLRKPTKKLEAEVPGVGVVAVAVVKSGSCVVANRTQDVVAVSLLVAMNAGDANAVKERFAEGVVVVVAAVFPGQHRPEIP